MKERIYDAEKMVEVFINWKPVEINGQNFVLVESVEINIQPYSERFFVIEGSELNEDEKQNIIKKFHFGADFIFSLNEVIELKEVA